MNQSSYSIFTDGSFDPPTRFGVAGVLIVGNEIGFNEDELMQKIELKPFSNTTCTRLEIEAVLLAFSLVEIMKIKGPLLIYTDCKSIVDLPLRRERLERNSFKSRKSGLLLNNGDLFKKYFDFYDLLKPQVIWLKGHKPSNRRRIPDRLFSLVDKATRESMRRGLPF